MLLCSPDSLGTAQGPSGGPSLSKDLSLEKQRMLSIHKCIFNTHVLMRSSCLRLQLPLLSCSLKSTHEGPATLDRKFCLYFNATTSNIGCQEFTQSSAQSFLGQFLGRFEDLKLRTRKFHKLCKSATKSGNNITPNTPTHTQTWIPTFQVLPCEQNLDKQPAQSSDDHCDLLSAQCDSACKKST